MVIAERALGHLELAEDHGTGLAKPLHHRGVLGRAPVFEERHAAGRRHVGRLAEVLDRHRHAMQRAPITALADFALGLPGCFQGALGRQMRERVQPGLQPLDAVECRQGYLDRRDLVCPDGAGDRVQARERPVLAGVGSHSAALSSLPR